MKKLLFALLVLVGVVTFTPKAEAGQYRKVWNGHCYTYVNKYDCDSHYRPRHYNHSRYDHRPVRYYRNYDYCDRPVRYYSSRPRFAVSFGF